jgi:2-keto-3-deoxy-L-rhamnonate aldolase RhmA
MAPSSRPNPRIGPFSHRLPMNGHEFKAALRQGRRVYGTMFVKTRAGKGDERPGDSALDFLIVDNEHSPYNRAETSDWCHKLAGLGVVPFVRVPIPASHYITMALDGGAQGILAPYVERVEQVQECVAACKYLPLKGEAVDRAARTGQFPSGETKTWLAERNKNNVLVIGIESVAAMERLEQLLAVPGVDGAFVGPNDLSIQLGVPNQYQHPKYLEAVQRIHQTCIKKNVPLVIHFFTHEMAEPFIQDGVRFVLFGSDRAGVAELKPHFDFLRGVKAPGA